MKKEKVCIRCWWTEKEIRKEWIKGCYVWWESYKRHDYTEPCNKTDPNIEIILFGKSNKCKI